MTGESPSSLRHLPGMLGCLARYGHGGAALRLVAAWGGTKQRIPEHPRPDSQLAKLIGLDAALILAEHYPGWHDVPTTAGLRSLKQCILRRPESTRETALALKTSESYVRRVRRDAEWKKEERREPDLFNLNPSAE